MLKDGTLVNDNTATTYEAVGTAHSYSYPAQTVGSTHLLFGFFRAAWELVVSVSGGGTTNHTGTFEVADGSSSPSITASNGTQTFRYWLLDGDIYSESAAITLTAQQAGTTHTLTAVFT